MTRYKNDERFSSAPTDRIFTIGYGFLSFARNMGKNIGKNISKSVSGKYIPGMLAMHQKLPDHAKKSATVAFKTDSNEQFKKLQRQLVI